MKSRLLLPLTLAAAFAVAPAQERCAAGVMLVRYGAGDLVPNEPLIDALLADSELHAAIRELGASPGHGLRLLAKLPAAHLPGTCQIHITCQLWAADWNDDTAQRAIDLCADHLRRRLTALLYEVPRDELTARAEQLRRSCLELATQRSAREQQRDACAARCRGLEDLVHQLEQQALAAQIEARTEQRAMEQLDRLMAEHRARRDQAAAELAQAAAKRDPLRDRAAVAQMQFHEAEQRLRARPDDAEARDALQQLMNQVADLQAQLRDLDAQLASRDLPGEDAQRLLTATLEQIPLATLALQRATARRASIDEQRLALAEQLEVARRELAKARVDVDAAEQQSIDLTVFRAQLVEMQGKLARLEPVRLEVLHR